VLRLRHEVLILYQ